MKAILLAGGKGTRLRPLTLHTPKPIVPIFDRPFLAYQLDLLRKVPMLSEVVLSLNYQPRRIEEIMGQGEKFGVRLSYAVEPAPLGTGGAIKFAAGDTDDSVIVFNGDVMTSVDLPALVALHKARRAKATIVLTPVSNPSAYGLVETDAEGNVRRFLEKPKPDEISCNTINAGIYVLEPETFERIPTDTPFSIERQYFPTLVDRGEAFVAFVDQGYWIDIGTPEKYLQVHRDIMDGRFDAQPFWGRSRTIVSEQAQVADDAVIEGPCFVAEGAVIRSGARVLAHTVVGSHCQIESGATVAGSILWPNTWVGEEATLTDALCGRHCHVGRSVSVGPGRVLGSKTALTDYSRL